MLIQAGEGAVGQRQGLHARLVQEQSARGDRVGVLLAGAGHHGHRGVDPVDLAACAHLGEKQAQAGATIEPHVRHPFPAGQAKCLHRGRDHRAVALVELPGDAATDEAGRATELTRHHPVIGTGGMGGHGGAWGNAVTCASATPDVWRSGG